MQRRWYLGISTSNHQNKTNNTQINQTKPTNQTAKRGSHWQQSQASFTSRAILIDMSVNGFLTQTAEIPRQQSVVAGVVKYKTNSPSRQCQILHPVKNIHLVSKRRRHQAVSDEQKLSRHTQHKMLREILQDKRRQHQTAAPIGEKEWGHQQWWDEMKQRNISVIFLFEYVLERGMTISRKIYTIALRITKQGKGGCEAWAAWRRSRPAELHPERFLY